MYFTFVGQQKSIFSLIQQYTQPERGDIHMLQHIIDHLRYLSFHFLFFYVHLNTLSTLVLRDFEVSDWPAGGCFRWSFSMQFYGSKKHVLGNCEPLRPSTLLSSIFSV